MSPEPESIAQKIERETEGFIALIRRRRLFGITLLLLLTAYGVFTAYEKYATSSLSGKRNSSNESKQQPPPSGGPCTVQTGDVSGHVQVNCAGVPETALAALLELLKKQDQHIELQTRVANDWAARYAETAQRVEALTSRAKAEPTTKTARVYEEASSLVAEGRIDEARSKVDDYYSQALVPVVPNLHRVFDPEMTMQERKIASRTTIEISSTGGTVADVQRNSARLRIRISTDTLQMLEAMATALVVEAEGEFDGCAHEYGQHVASRLLAESRRASPSYVPVRLRSLPEIGADPISACYGIIEELPLDKERGAAFAAMMDAAIATVYLRGIVGQLDGPTAATLLCSRTLAWDETKVERIAKAAAYDLSAALPITIIESTCKGLAAQEQSAPRNAAN